MQTVHVICGGTSSEREVSLRSGAAVAKALETAGYTVKTLDTDAPIGEIVACDVVFPVLHGKGGEDGSLQKQLEEADARFVGTGSVASGVCYDKSLYRSELAHAGFPMAAGDLVTTETFPGHPLAQTPYVLKPYDGGSSIDTFIVRNVHDKTMQEAIAAALTRHESMLLETLIEGVEITVGVLDQAPLPVIEIIPPESGEFDYENKYNGKTQELCPPAHVDTSVQAAAQQLAINIHTLTGCRDFSRTDMIVTPSGELFVLETNTIPGMTDQSLFPKMVVTAGIGMVELVDLLVKMSLNRETAST